MYKKIGIWAEEDKAYLIRVNTNGTSVKLIHPVLNQYSGNSDPADKPKGSREMSNAFFQKILDELHQVEEIYLFGSHSVATWLHNALNTSSRHLFQKIHCERNENISDIQKIAQVRAHFAL